MKRFSSALSMVTVIPVTVLMMLLAALPAFEEENPCSKDFKERCGYVTPGGGRLVRCYEERKDETSPACRAWAERVKANAEVLKAVCASEIDSSCNFEKGGPY